MKKITTLILVLFTSFCLFAQEKFELNASAKLGCFFPKNETNNPYYPDNAISPGGGISLQYNLFGKTNISLGVEGNYLSPAMTDYWGNELDSKWHSLNIPFYATQGIGSHFFITGGATIVRQFSGYWDDPRTPYRNQKVPEFNWQTGIGWDFDKISISINYTHGFNTVEKKIKTGSDSSFDVDVKHQEIYLKVEYPLWCF